MSAFVRLFLPCDLDKAGDLVCLWGGNGVGLEGTSNIPQPTPVQAPSHFPKPNVEGSSMRYRTQLNEM
jgi:hypothetical protein